MHDHDLDLIAAHADGTLDDPAAQVEAARLVEACPVCATEFRTQQTVKGWLGAAPSVTLTETERSRLHADVAAQTGSEASVASLPAKAAGRVPGALRPESGRRAGALRSERIWMRLSAVAAGLFVVAAGGGIILSLGRQPARDGFSSAAATTTSAAAPTFAEQTTAALEMAGEARLAPDAGSLTRAQLPGHLEDMTERAKAGEDDTIAAGAANQSVFRCEQALPGEVQERATATVDGQPAELYVYEVESELRADAFDSQTCESLLP